MSIFEEKKAIVAVSFGSSDTDAAKLLKKSAEFFEKKTGVHTFLSFTSSFACRSLNEKSDVYIEYLPDMMEKLCMLGYHDVKFVMMFLKDKAEYTKAVTEIEKYKHLFKNISLTRPLLDSEDDLKRCIEAIKEKEAENERELLFLIHDFSDDDKVTVTKDGDKLIPLSKICKEKSKEDIDALDLKNHSVKLIPLMFTFGVHAKRDIAFGEKSAAQNLKSCGYDVKVSELGLCCYDKILDMFLEKL